MNVTLDELKAKLLEEELKTLFTEAYEQGLQDARSEGVFPHLLKKTDLAEIFQVALPTVESIIRLDGFPKSKAVTARYPRDLVFEWINENVDYVESRFGLKAAK